MSRYYIRLEDEVIVETEYDEYIIGVYR